MNKVIPILPCPNMATQIEFFAALGFEHVGEYRQPNSYAVMRCDDIELHFWVNKKLIPAENPTMCILQVEDVHSLCADFTEGLKSHYGKIPRTGAPKITKVRELKEDTRFTLTDTGGNTFYVCMPRVGIVALRTLDSVEHTKDFAVLYDLMHSKESPEIAARLLPRLTAVMHELSDLDKAKLLILTCEIQAAIGQPYDYAELAVLLDTNRHISGDWDELKSASLTLLQS